MSDRRYLVKEMFGPTLQGEGAHARSEQFGARSGQGDSRFLAMQQCGTQFLLQRAQAGRYRGLRDIQLLRRPDQAADRKSVV